MSDTLAVVLVAAVWVAALASSYAMHRRDVAEEHTPYTEYDSPLLATLHDGTPDTCDTCGMNDLPVWPPRDSHSDYAHLLGHRCGWCREQANLANHLNQHGHRR